MPEIDPLDLPALDPDDAWGGQLNTALAALREGVRSSASRGEGTSSLIAALPNLHRRIRLRDDSNPADVLQLTLGSSVFTGPNGSSDPENAPGEYLHAALERFVNRTGAVSFVHVNAAVNGSTVTAAQQTGYAAGKATAGQTPALVPLGYGMNDGMSGQYHQGQTLEGVYANGKTLIQAIQGDGADPIIFTTPHPHTGRTPWAVSGGYSYPSSSELIPNDAEESVVPAPGRDGVPASYRHLRVNESLRQLGADMGVPVIDVEAYWFDAVAAVGEDALFGEGEYAHPNLLAHELAFHAAIDDFVRGLEAPVYASAPPPPKYLFVRKPQNTARANDTDLRADPELVAPVGANRIVKGRLVVFHTTATAADLRLGVSVPPGSVGRFSVTGPAKTATGPSSEVVARSGSATPGNYMEVGGNDTDGLAVLEFLVEVGATAGSIALVWCQDSGNAQASVVYANSFLELTEVG